MKRTKHMTDRQSTVCRACDALPCSSSTSSVRRALSHRPPPPPPLRSLSPGEKIPTTTPWPSGWNSPSANRPPNTASFIADNTTGRLRHTNDLVPVVRVIHLIDSHRAGIQLPTEALTLLAVAVLEDPRYAQPLPHPPALAFFPCAPERKPPPLRGHSRVQPSILHRVHRGRPGAPPKLAACTLITARRQ